LIKFLQVDDGNDIGKPTPIWAAKLSPDGNSFSSDSKPIELLRNTLPWEGPLIEGPWHIYRAPYHYIFYSGNGYGSPEYAIGVARSKDPLGPYEKYGDPIMRSNDAFKGPGHCSVVSKDDKNQEFVMVYHSWIKDHILDPKYGRYMLIDRVRWTNDSWPYFTSSSPSVDPQPIP
jgi:arabinan endo-1,5-alpha-L-arabinosidase